MKTTYTDSPTIQLVKFEAPWCGPCAALQKTLDKLHHGDELGVMLAHVNIDDNPEIAKRFGVRGLPTLALIKDGKIIASKTGGLTESIVVGFLKVHYP